MPKLHLGGPRCRRFEHRGARVRVAVGGSATTPDRPRETGTTHHPAAHPHGRCPTAGFPARSSSRTHIHAGRPLFLRTPAPPPLRGRSPRPHASIASQSRTSPTGAWVTRATRRSARPRSAGSSFPPKVTCPMAPDALIMGTTSTDSAVGVGGRPRGPEENSHTSRQRRARTWRPPPPVSYTHLRAHETDSYLVCRLLLEKKKT